MISLDDYTLPHGERIPRNTCILWVSNFLWISFLMWLSSQNGADTNLTSSRLAAFIIRLFGIMAERTPEVNHLLRTAAHFVVFLVLGFSLHCTVWLTWPNCVGSAFFSFASGALLAVADEVKKLWIAGRHLSWAEAGLNCAGAAAGVLFALVCIGLAARGPGRGASWQSCPGGGGVTREKKGSSSA